MKIKKNIKLLIKILEESKINDLEVSSFWGFRKIKLSKKISSINTHPAIDNLENGVVDKKVSIDIKKNIEKDSEESFSEKLPAPLSQETVSTENVEAPLVGTVYLSAKPGEPQFIEEGGAVKKGQVICIIEAMKIFNEIESDKDGIVRKILVKNEDPIEFGQPLIEIEV